MIKSIAASHFAVSDLSSRETSNEINFGAIQCPQSWTSRGVSVRDCVVLLIFVLAAVRCHCVVNSRCGKFRA